MLWNVFFEGDSHICYTRTKFSIVVSQGVPLVSGYHGMHLWEPSSRTCRPRFRGRRGGSAELSATICRRQTCTTCESCRVGHAWWLRAGTFCHHHHTAWRWLYRRWRRTCSRSWPTHRDTRGGRAGTTGQRSCCSQASPSLAPSSAHFGCQHCSPCEGVASPLPQAARAPSCLGSAC